MTSLARSLKNAWQNTRRVMHGNLATMSFTSMLGMFSRSMAYPYVSLYILALHGDPEQIGLINALAPLLGLIAFPLGGYLADHVGRVKLMGWTTIIAASMELLYAVAPSWEWLALASLLMGFSVVQFPAQSALLADSTTPQDRSRAIGLMNTISSLPSMAAPWVAGLVIDAVGIDPGARYLYAFLGCGNILVGFAVLRLLHETRSTPPEPFHLAMVPRLLWSTYSGLGALLRPIPRTALAVGIIGVIGLAVNAIAGPFWVVQAIDGLGLTATEWGIILLLESAVRILSMAPAGVLADRIGRSRCMLLSLSMLAVALPLFTVVHGYWGVLFVRLLIGLADGIFVPASVALLADSIPRQMRGRVLAAIGQGSVLIGSSSGGTGGPALGYLVIVPLILSSLASGYIYDAGVRLPWLVSFGLILVTLVIAALYVRDPHQAEV
ncbi:MAG: MFS transporter [Anaerolineales bacterium]